MHLLNIPTLDIIAVTVFLFCWLIYGVLAQSVTSKRASLISEMRHYRQRWIESMIERENHTADATLLANLLRGALFFASTTVFILGGLVALLGTAPQVAEIISQLPYAVQTEPRIAEIKALILIFVFVFAFFKFTWSAWQYNVLAILVGAMPDPKSDAEVRRRYGEMASRVLWLAGESYNHGIRAYYFAIAMMAWFIDPWLFLAATLIVTFVLYRREFHSPMLAALKKNPA
jgi:uncharacterized membrane protein